MLTLLQGNTHVQDNVHVHALSESGGSPPPPPPPPPPLQATGRHDLESDGS